MINHSIKPEKGKAWHIHMHPYFTKQASNVVREYIEDFSKEGDTILDPFCGTGVTAIEALALKRKVIAIDLNPLACFITEQTVAQIDTKKFLKAFVRIKKNIGEEIQRIDNLSDKQIEKVKFQCWYPKGIRLPKNSDKGYDFVEQLWTKRQLLCLSLLWNEINKITDIDIKNQMKLVFSATISRVNIMYNLSMSRQKAGKDLKLGDGGAAIFAQYRYWIPKNLVELRVWDRFVDRFKRILRAKEKWGLITNGFIVKENFKCITASVLELNKYIPDNSIDYIYTDPPYGGNIAYLDLSTMWNAWLGFDIDDKMRNEEIIEGGDLDKTQKNYEELLSLSFEQMSKTLKKDSWLSLVFAHKKLEFWNVIIDSNESNGMEYKGSVYQPTNNSSIHYKKNIANVLCSQRIANFQKTFEKSNREMPDDLKQYILHEMERICIEKRGASIDEIYQRVLDHLLGNNTIHEAKKKGYLKLDYFLDNVKLFVFEPDTNKYHVQKKEDRHDIYEQDYFKHRNELEVYIKSLLKNKPLTFDEIHQEIFAIYSDEKKFPNIKIHRDLYDILEEVAYKNTKTKKWILRKPDQVSIEFKEVLTDKLIKILPGGSTHSEIIFRLVQIGKYLGFYSWIGKREQSVDSFQGFDFNIISSPELPLPTTNKPQSEKIQQIDVIWFDKVCIPRYAFEIEESTNIMTGLERFKNILDIQHDLSNKLFIVAPRSRTRKIKDVFFHSSYVGAPLYLDNKVGVIYREELVKFYDTHIDIEFDEKDFSSLFEILEP